MNTANFFFPVQFGFSFSGNVGNPEAGHCGERDERVRTLKSTYTTTRKKYTASCVAYSLISGLSDPDPGFNWILWIRIRNQVQDPDLNRKVKMVYKKKKNSMSLIRCQKEEKFSYYIKMKICQLSFSLIVSQFKVCLFFSKQNLGSGFGLMNTDPATLVDSRYIKSGR